MHAKRAHTGVGTLGVHMGAGPFVKLSRAPLWARLVSVATPGVATEKALKSIEKVLKSIEKAMRSIEKAWQKH